MILTDRINTALAAWLTEDYGITVTVQSGLEASRTTEADTRMVCTSIDCGQLGPHLRGVYRCTGEVIVRQSIDSTDAYDTFKSQCSLLHAAIGDEEAVVQGVSGKDARLNLYPRSWHVESMEEAAGKRGFQAVFTWRCVARDSPTTK